MSDLNTRDSKGVILLVDDTPSDVHPLSDFLTGKGFDVRFESSGRAAIQTAVNDPPEIILLDVKMPEMDGYEVCERLKAVEDFKSIPVLFIGVLDETMDKVQGFDVGGADYITKPFEFVEVLARVEAHLTNARMKIQLELVTRELDAARRTSERLHANLEEQVQRRTSELENANKALREIKTQFEAVYNHHYQLTGLIDKKGRLLMGNRTALEFAGVEAEDVVGKRFWETPWWTHSQEAQRMLREAMERAMRGEMVHFESTHISAAGETRNIDFSIGPVFDDDGEVIYLVPEGYDITERKRAEEALRESEERFRTVLEANPDPVVLYDIEGKVIYFNPAFTHVFGWNLEECINNKMNVFVPEEAWPETKAMINKVLAGESFSGIETRRLTKNGKIIPVSISGAVYRDQENKPVGNVVNLRDITEQKVMEKQLIQAQKMESIGTLAGGIAHDFNNILSPIILYTEMVLEDISEKGPLRFSLEEILKASMRAKELVKQILTFSRQTEQEKIPLIIYPVIKEALRLLRSSLPSTIEIRQNIEAEDSVVLADPTQIHQILMNIGTNAANAMRERGGVLKVSLVYVDLHSDDTDHIADLEPGQYIKLTVSDTGHGIKPAIMDKIFDPYFTTQEKGKGTGLGLSVVHGIVNSHGGHISAYSEPDKRTRFDVYLPLFDLADIKAETVFPEKLTIGNEHILLVDDEKPIVDVVQQMLERLGYQVTVRTSSIEALEVFRALMNKFDLVITDLTMPNMTGDKLAGEFMNIRPDIPIILCTGFSEKMSKERAEALGVKGFLMKPIVKNDIAKTVREVLDKS